MVLDEIGKHFLEHAVELVKSGKKFVYVVDNVDWEERVHDMRAIHQNKSAHAVATSMVFSRVSSDHLDESSPQKDIKIVNCVNLLRCQMMKLTRLRIGYKMLVARILMKKFAKFASMQSYISEEVNLSHENSDSAAIKSEVITMPVLMKDEKKYSELC